METQSEIKKHLNRHANVYANSKGFNFGSGAKYDIENMAGFAATNILNPPPKYLDNPVNLLVEIAEKNISIFIENMIIAREKVYDDLTGPKIIGEKTFAWARKIICPMWPIC